MTRDDRTRAIGKVVSVSADRFVVELNFGTDNFTVVGFKQIRYVARLGSFLMIPVYTEYVVGEIIGLRERDMNESMATHNDFSNISSVRYLDVVPVGMLPQKPSAQFRFGVSVYPSLYSDVLYAHDEELDRIFETDRPLELLSLDSTGTTQTHNVTRSRTLSIGQSVVFTGYEVKVKIDEFFGGHVAILGNTGSGKSCTVVSILQSLFSKPDEYLPRGTTFIVLDINGEYTRSLDPIAVDSELGIEELKLDGSSNEGRFRLPHWFLNQSEWVSLLQASERTQIPVLRTALGLSSIFTHGNETSLKVKEHILAKHIIACMQGSLGDSTVAKFQRIHSLLEKHGRVCDMLSGHLVI